ncbi:CAP-Gly domain protein [Ceratobasidium sp. AG-Ba]|nr:CAP-Gly domain protein [Ceratobasidium sp. AG-Ba]
MTTPARPAPRVSGIPGPGARSGIPTPGITRPRSSTGSNTVGAPRSSGPDTEAMNRALQDAIRANDPSRHSSESLSPPFSAAASVSGRRSVAGGARPPSVASSSSNRLPPPRSKTPVSAVSATSTSSRTAFAPRASLPSRPDSRASNIGRSLSRAGHEFDVGDAVKIESLGMEGTLQFMGEIEGKSGIWAGVELSPAFAGRGKNDGSVNGIHYFTCAPKCGVFTLPNKLSPATAGRYARPASVNSMASSRAYGGRTTPSVSGRITPSHAPAPRSLVTPAARKINPFGPGPDSKVTPGSRASKYIGMTANELGMRNGSPSTNSSPTRSASTPQGTPKAPRALPTPRTRQSMGMPTPKASRPLTNMPPPPLPMGSPRRVPRPSTVTPTLSHASSETFVDDPADPQNAQSVMSVLDMNDKAIQEKIALLLATKSGAQDDPTEAALASPVARGTPDSSALEARIARLERENESLKAELSAKTASIAEEAEVLNAAIERAVALEEDKKTALAKITELERAHEKALKERQDKLDASDRAAQAADKTRAELETRIKDEENKRTDAEALVASLKEALASKSSVAEEHVAELKAKNDEIALLEGRVQRLDTDLQFERRELGQQVEELRQAGQETIALYEERISGMEARRYELEDVIAELEAKLAQRAASPGTVARQASTAAEIDNESLREQVSHLQRRLGLAEDQLEDARAQLEREEGAAIARVTKAKDAEAAAKLECEALKREMEGVRKDDAALKVRVEELVEALRENAVTLEGARADVEGLRAEVADLEVLKAGGGEATPVARDDSVLVAQLRRDLEDAKKALETAEKAEIELHEQLEGLEKEKFELEQLVEATTLKQTADQKLIAELQEKTLKRSSRDTLKNVTSQEQLRAESPDTRRNSVDSDSSKMSKGSGGPGKREQIAGLKVIISGLEEEIRQWTSKCSMLEQENKILQSGTEQLQIAMRRLEDRIDDRLPKEGDAEAGGDGERIKRIETENELMKTKITEMEQKHARAVLDLNKEITELENLVESKIYREDDLERELERYKEKLARATRGSSKLSGESMLVNGGTNGTVKASKNAGRPEISVITSSGELNRCELCDSQDHDGMDCPLLHVEDNGKQPASAVSSEWCDDCEEFGHTVQSCPNSQDVF